MLCVCGQVMSTSTVFTTLPEANYLPTLQSFHGFSVWSVLVMFLPPHQIPVANSHRFVLQSLGFCLVFVV